jgi:hypothetical protein
LLGENKYGKTYSLYRFNIYLADTTLAYIKAGTAYISKVQVKMKPVYMQGDSTASFRFTARQIRSDWGLVSFDRDSLSTIKNTADSRNVITSFSTTETPTLKDSIIFNIDPSVVKEWVTYDSTDSSLPKNYGLLFTPENTNKVLGFNASTLTDTTKMVYMYITVHKDSWGDYEELVTVSPFMDTHMTERIGSLPTSEDKIYLEGSYGVSGFLHFDLSKIPSNIILNKVVLTMEMDPSLSYQGSPTSDSLGLTVFADSTTRKYTSDSTTTTLLIRNGNIFSGDITWMVQDWLLSNGSYPNEGVELYILEDSGCSSRIVLYGSKYADKSKRPKLDIYYTQKN